MRGETREPTTGDGGKEEPTTGEGRKNQPKGVKGTNVRLVRLSKQLFANNAPVLQIFA